MEGLGGISLAFDELPVLVSIVEVLEDDEILYRSCIAVEIDVASCGI